MIRLFRTTFTKMKKPFLSRIPPWVKNKYFLTIVAFIIWVCFFDKNDLISQFSFRKELRELEEDKAYYIREIEKNKKDMTELMSDPEHLEKYAREHYLMKKEEEEIFIIVRDTVREEE